MAVRPTTLARPTMNSAEHPRPCSPSGERVPPGGALALRRALASLAFLVATLLPACRNSSAGTLPVQRVRVVNEYPHDPDAYCQGLLFHDGALYESTGRHGTSSVRRVALESGEVTQITRLPMRLFGEGLALHAGELYQLTWRERVVRVYDASDLSLSRELPFRGEGWGLASDGTHLFQTDGTHVVRVRDPETLEELRRFEVRLGDASVFHLNELEFVEGELWANVWQTERIVRMDPEDGRVLGWIDLSGIFDPSSIDDDDAVLNGIAYDAEEGRIFVTGKLWPKLFEVRLVDE